VVTTSRSSWRAGSSRGCPRRRLAADLQAAGTQLELLIGPLTGVYDPTGMGAMLFPVCAVTAQLDRDYSREKTLEGQQGARLRGKYGSATPR